jgi:hypothetical protein
MAKYPEDNLQTAVATYLDYFGVLWFHCANERKTSPQAGARLKAKGVKSGVPDVMILEPKGKYNGLAIELKIKPNVVTVNQKAWLKRLELKKWYCVVCYSFDEVQQTVEDYLNKKV